MRQTCFIIASIIAIIGFSAGIAQNKNAIESQQDEKSKIKMEKEFVTQLNKHIKAIHNRDIAAYTATISNKYPVINLFKDGGMSKGHDESVALHRNWFAMKWKLKTTVMETEVYGDTARALVHMELTIMNPNQDPYLEDTLWTLIFVRENNEWRMAFNQSTEIMK